MITMTTDSIPRSHRVRDGISGDCILRCLIAITEDFMSVTRRIAETDARYASFASWATVPNDLISSSANNIDTCAPRISANMAESIIQNTIVRWSAKHRKTRINS